MIVIFDCLIKWYKHLSRSVYVNSYSITPPAEMFPGHPVLRRLPFAAKQISQPFHIILIQTYSFLSNWENDWSHCLSRMDNKREIRICFVLPHRNIKEHIFLSIYFTVFCLWIHKQLRSSSTFRADANIEGDSKTLMFSSAVYEQNVDVLPQPCRRCRHLCLLVQKLWPFSNTCISVINIDIYSELRLVLDYQKRNPY